MIDLPPADPGIEVTIASRGISKGIAQTEGPQIVVKPSIQTGPVQLGGQWKNLSSPTARGEASLFANVAPKVGGFQLSLGAAYKFQTGVREPTDDKSWEFTGHVIRKFGRLSLKLAAIYSPDDLGTARRSLFVEGGPTLEVGKTMRLSAAVGRRDRVDGDDYTAFNAGIAKTLFKGLTLDARYFGTNRSSLGEFYQDRVVLSAKMSF